MHTLSDLAKNWAKQDPQAALAWAENSRNYFTKQPLLREIAFGLCENQPEQATLFADRLPSGAWRSEIYRVAGGNMAKLDPRRALAWAPAIESPAMRKAAMESVMNYSLVFHPETALPAALSEQNAPVWLPHLIDAMDVELRRAPGMGYGWKLDGPALDKIKAVIETTAPPARRPAMFETIARFAAKKEQALDCGSVCIGK